MSQGFCYLGSQRFFSFEVLARTSANKRETKPKARTSMGSNPVGASEFFLGFICNCLSNFVDHFHLYDQIFIVFTLYFEYSESLEMS